MGEKLPGGRADFGNFDGNLDFLECPICSEHCKDGISESSSNFSDVRLTRSQAKVTSASFSRP